MPSSLFRPRLVRFCFAFTVIATLYSASAFAQLSRASQQPRITARLDESSLTTLTGNTHPLAQPKFDQGPAPASMPVGRMLLVLARSTQQEADLQTWLQSLQDAHSPNFHKFLTPAEFGQRFGIGDADLQTVRTWLTGHGLTVSKVSAGRTTIEFSGTVGQLESTFHTSLHSYLVHGQQHYANASDPQIPTALAPVVAGVTALNGFRPKAQSIRGPSGIYNLKDHTVTPSYTTGSATNGYYMFVVPADAATIYNTPTALNPNLSGTAYDGSGVTIGVVGDSNIDITQNANYRATFGLSPKPTTVVVDGNDPGENGDAVEAYLDTEVSGGLAPNANILFYASANTDYQSGVFLAMLRAIDDNVADILNVSFIECEAGLGTAGNLLVNSLWEQAAAQGISVTVSSGDGGPAGCDDFDTEQVASQGFAVNGLGSTPYNISVGGTDFDTLYSNFPNSFSQYVNLENTLPDHRSALSYIPEEPWNDSTVVNGAISADKPVSSETGNTQDNDIVAGSGGISTVYPLPSWQTSFGTGKGRNLPDVSLLAGNGFYGALWATCTDQDSAGPDCAPGAQGISFNVSGVGGTSASSPAFAGVLALIEQKAGSRLGQADAVLYDLAKSHYSTVFHDITAGNNSVNCQANSSGCAQNAAGYDFMTGYNATTGYDDATGLGSVDVSQLAGNWASAGLASSTSALQLNGATTALNLTHGQSVSVNASVTTTGATPSGDVALVDSLSPATHPNSESIAAFTLADGAASGTTNALPGGTYQVSAHYGGSTTVAESDSNSINVTVAPEASSTAVTVAGYFDPATGKAASTPYYGFIYLIDAQPYGNSASATNPNGAATGTITFKDGSATLGTAALSSEGVAEIQTAALPGGNNSLTAVFPGDASFQPSTSSPNFLTVIPALTTLNSAASVPSILAGGAVTFTVTLTADSAGAAPTGTVKFEDGSTILGSVALAGVAGTTRGGATGNASLTDTTLPYGPHSIVAIYSGDSNYGASQSSAVPVTIFPASAAVIVTPPNPAIPVNQPITLPVEVSPFEAGGLPAPTGTITLSYLGQTTPPATIASSTGSLDSTATFTIPANTLPVGTTTVTANYSGDLYYGPASSTSYVNTKNIGTILPTVTVSAPTQTVNYPISATVTITGVSGKPTPTGLVSLGNGIHYGSQATSLANGAATFSITSGLEPGTNTLTATYQGDKIYSNGSGVGTVTLFATPILSLSPDNPTVVANQALTISITVGGFPTIGTPTGTVTVSSGTYTSSATALSAGTASVTIPASTLAVGSDTLTVSYSGDKSFDSTSATETVTVTPAPPPGLSIAGSSVTLTPGATTSNTSTITVTPANGFTGSVALTASITTSPAGAQDPPTLSFGTTSPVSITTANPGTATLTISTTAPTSAALERPSPTRGMVYAAGAAALACFLLIGIPRRRRSLRTLLSLSALLITLACGALACGGGSKSGGGGGGGTSDPGTTAGAYVITVTATSGTITTTTTVNLTVQ